MSSVLSELEAFLSQGRQAWRNLRKTAVIDMLAYNWHLGLTSFGGPAVHFQIFRQRFVEKYQWLNETTYEDLFALCQALSGPASTKMLYSINAMRYGQLIGILSFFVWSLPMAITAWGLGLGVDKIQTQLPGPAYALLSGLNSATVGIISLAAVQLSQKAITDTLTRILVFLGGTAGMLYNSLWYFPVLMVAGALITLTSDLRLIQKTWKSLRQNAKSGQPTPPHTGMMDMQAVEQANAEHPSHRPHARMGQQATGFGEPHSDHSSEVLDGQAPATRSLQVISWKTGLTVVAVFLTTFIAVMIFRAVYGGRNRGFDLFANLYLAGTIIFGGGPVVVPLLRTYTVTPGWVSSRDFLLGLAITQAFPGPNFNFAVYLGVLAVRNSGIAPTAGAIIGFVAMFAPGMWLCAGFLGLWSSARKIQAVRACLRGVHATAVGLVFTAVYRLFEIGYLDSEVSSGGSLSRDPWWIVIIGTTFVGGMHFKLVPPLAILLGGVMGLIWYGIVNTG